MPEIDLLTTMLQDSKYTRKKLDKMLHSGNPSKFPKLQDIDSTFTKMLALRMAENGSLVYYPDEDAFSLPGRPPEFSLGARNRE